MTDIAMIKETCNLHSGIVARVGALETSDTHQWNVIEKLKDRLPVWATLMLMGLCTIIGALIGFIAATGRIVL